MFKLPLFLLFSVLSSISFTQSNFEEHWVRIIANDSLIIPRTNRPSTNAAFQQILTDFQVDYIAHPMGFAKTAALRNVFEFHTPLSADSLFLALYNFNKGSNIMMSVERLPKVKYLSEPADDAWGATDSTEYLWYLKKIKADLAWNITKGDTSVKVAIIDSGVDLNHPDLIGKVDPPYDFYTGLPFVDSDTNASNNVVTDLRIHGTGLASLVAAETVEIGQSFNGDMASIGWNTRVMFSQRNLQTITASAPTAIYFYSSAEVQCLYASTVMNAKILNISWSSGFDASNYDTIVTYFENEFQSSLLIEKEILDNGTTVIRAAGNDGNANGGRQYPFSGREDERVIVVSSTGSDDKHFNTLSNGNNTNSHYSEVDLCAPGYRIYCARPSTYLDGTPVPSSILYGLPGGTSQSTPIVVGTAALMYSVNPCLTPSWVQDILKNTTDPIVDAADYPGLVGTGRLNAYKAVLAAQQSHSTTLDLFIKDRPEDLGNQQFPYHWQAARDESPDIWVRNQPDGLTNQIHQEPEFNSSSPVYVYVRVHNKSCVPSTGNELLKLYWTKASSLTSWPENWDGSQPTIGNLIGSSAITNLAPGRDTIVQFIWNVLNPYIYQNWSSCLMARIENSSVDTITIYPDRADDDVFYNNNVALRNCTVLDIFPGVINPGSVNGIYFPVGSYMFLGNTLPHNEFFNLKFISRDTLPISRVAEVKLIFDDEGWGIMKNYFASSPDFQVLRDKEVVVKNASSTLKDVELPSNTRFPMYVGFSLRTDELNPILKYKFDIEQHLSADSSYMGGEHYTINSYNRPPFDANAGQDKYIYYGDSITITAEDISEISLYNWYDAQGNLIFTGKDIVISPEVQQKFKLEVIALSDGTKDYDEVEVFVKDNFIKSISPNPSNSNSTVTYSLNNCNSAYLMILNQTATQSDNYILDTNGNETTIDVSDFNNGIYTVVLVCDGIATDAKTLIIQ